MGIAKRIRVGTDIVKTLLYHKMTGKRIPLLMNLQITKRCNLRCRYCYVDFESLKGANDWSTEQVKKIIDELYDCGTRWFRLLGGEPLLREDIGEIIDYVNSKGVLCEMTTNGIFVRQRKEILDLLKKLDGVCFSVDGDERANSLNRGGSHEAIMQGLSLCVENKIPARIHCTLTRYSKDSLDYMAELSERLGVYFNYAEFSASNEEQKDLELTKDERDDFYRRYREYKRKGYRISNSLTAIDMLLDWPGKEKFELSKEDLKTLKSPRFVLCKESRLTGYLDVDGKVYGCVHLWKLGVNSFEVGFKKAWEYLDQVDCVTCKCANHDLCLLLNLDTRVAGVLTRLTANVVARRLGLARA